MEFNFSNYKLKKEEHGDFTRCVATIDVYSNPGKGAAGQYVHTVSVTREAHGDYAIAEEKHEAARANAYSALDAAMTDGICKYIAQNTCLPRSILYEVKQGVGIYHEIYSIADRIKRCVAEERRRAGFVAGEYPDDWGKHAEDPERED